MQSLEEIVKKLSDQYKFNYDEAIKLFDHNTDIILPFCGIIADNCKGIKYNHALYTQCTDKPPASSDFCKVCDKQKYGRIEDRQKCSLGEFVTTSGKKEVNYNTFMKKMGYTQTGVEKALKDIDLCADKIGLEFAQVSKEKRGRGRPKKCEKKVITNEEKVLSSDSESDIEVVCIKIDGIEYLRTEEGMILDRRSHEVIGIYNNGKIDEL